MKLHFTKNRARKRIVQVAIMTCILIFIGVMIFPFAWLLLTSVKHPVEIYGYPPTLFPKVLTTDNLKAIITSYDPIQAQRLPIMRELRNSIIVALGVVLISLPISVPAAYVVHRSNKRWPKLLMLLVMFIRTVPALSLALPLYQVIRSLGLLNTNFGLIIAHLTLTVPLALFLMFIFLRDLPTELEEAAFVDGCTPFGVFWRVVIPISAPGIAVSAILCFIMSYNEFLFSLVLMATEAGMTLPVGLSMFIMQSGIQWNLLTAAGVLGIIPLVIFALIVQRFIVQGLTLGAVKG